MKKYFFSLLLFVLFTSTGMAQMKFSFNGINTTEEVLADGSTLIRFPSGTDLNALGDKMTVSIGGNTVSDLSAITPNPTTTLITDWEIETFVHDGKAYSFRFALDDYFTAVIFSDPHVEQTNYGGLTVANEQIFVNNIVKLGKAGGRTLAFSKAPVVPMADIVFCLGDMDKDSESSGSDFTNAVSGFNTAQVPFITMAGNHDLVPDYWTGDNPDNGLTWGSTAGAGCNDKALSIISTQRTKAAGFGGFTVDVIKDADFAGDVQIEPFAFTFKGVRFYCGQTYWFQKPYKKPQLWSSATYYAPDGVIDALEADAKKNKDVPAVWMQHYPFVYGSDCDRWWVDQNDKGLFIRPTDTSAYITSDLIYTSNNPDAKAKKDKLASIIKQTKNPIHFSGHVHSNATHTYNGVTDMTIGQPGNVYLVLCKRGVGVVEVVTANLY